MATNARLVFSNSPAAASWPYPTWVWRVCRANLEQVQLLTQILVTNARRHLNLHSHPLFPGLLACSLPLLTWTLGTALHETTQAKDNCSLVLLHHLQREKREREKARRKSESETWAKCAKLNWNSVGNASLQRELQMLYLCLCRCHWQSAF